MQTRVTQTPVALHRRRQSQGLGQFGAECMGAEILRGPFGLPAQHAQGFGDARGKLIAIGRRRGMGNAEFKQIAVHRQLACPGRQIGKRRLGAQSQRQRPASGQLAAACAGEPELGMDQGQMIQCPPAAGEP